METRFPVGLRWGYKFKMKFQRIAIVVVCRCGDNQLGALIRLRAIPLSREWLWCVYNSVCVWGCGNENQIKPFTESTILFP